MAKKTKGWLDNYNDYSVSAPEGFQGDGFDMTGRNYSPAWGGQFQDGGDVSKASFGINVNRQTLPTAYITAKVPKRNYQELPTATVKGKTKFKAPMSARDNTAAPIQLPNGNWTNAGNLGMTQKQLKKYMSSPGDTGFNDAVNMLDVLTDAASFIPGPAGKVAEGLGMLIDAGQAVDAFIDKRYIDGAVNTTSALLPFIPKSTYKTLGNIIETGYDTWNMLSDREKEKLPLNPKKQMGGSVGGGSLSGATGMMYARHGAPSNGPYAKKTMPSAQDGSQIDPIAQEMKSYVESPLYLQRLKGMKVNDPELLQQSRANNLKNVTFATGPSDNTNVDSHGWPLVTLKPGSSEYTKAHELGHAISSYGGITNVSSMTEAGSNQMSPREAWYIMNRNVNTAKTPYQINPLASEKNKTVRESAWDLQHDDKNKLYSSISPFPNSESLEGIDITSQYHGKLDPHDVNAGENYGDLTALRHALLKQGYTKSFGENLSQETLNKAFQDQKIKNIKQVQRMRRNFNDASILDINNKIAYQDNNQGDIFARDGASVYYQYGLDFTPKSMKNGGEMIKRADGSYSRRGLWDNIRANIGSKKAPTKEMLKQEKKIKAKSKQDGGPIPIDPLGYWNPDNVGNPVIIPSTDITMKGVDQDLIGVSNTGDVKRMKKGKNYKFDGDYVTEYPTMQYGGELTKLDQLTNFTNYNTKQPGGWLDKYK